MIQKYPTTHVKFHSILSSLSISLLLLAACSLPSPNPSILSSPTSPVLLPSPTSLAPSFTPETPQFTPTSSLPSPTPQPTATSTPGPLNIAFTLGTTAAVKQGTVQPGQVVMYTLDAEASQPMILRLDSQKGDATLGVLEPNGAKLLDPANKWTYWQWLLPKTGLYTIQVIGGAAAQTYVLTAKVAQVVNFASGATSITLNGSTVSGYVFSYSLNCKANQTMTATLNVPSSTAYLDIFGLATGTLLSASAKANTWTGVLPETQAYVIEVIPTNGNVVNYTLTVSVH